MSTATTHPGAEGSPWQKERSLFFSLVVDFVFFLPDVAAAILANSIIMFADVLKCSCELLATFFSWMVMRKIARGRTFFYDYGFGKIENFTGVIVAGVMCLCVGLLLFAAFFRILHPEPVHRAGASLGVILMSCGVCVNTWLAVKNRRLARQAPSPIMESQWRLFMTKAIADGTVLSSLVISVALHGEAWTHYIDPAASFVIIGFLGFSIYSVASDSVYDLLDRTVEETTQMTILQHLAAHFNDYSELHGVRSRRAGGNVFIEIFLEFDGDQRMAEVQRVVDEIKSGLESKIRGGCVSIVPASSGSRPLKLSA